MPKDGKIDIAFLIFPGFPMSCLTSMIEPLRAAGEIAGADAFGWRLIAERCRRVASSAAVGFDPDEGLREARRPDRLFLLSGPAGAFEDRVRGEGRLREMARHGAVLGGVSGGVFPLARAGLLDGRRASVHWCYEAAFRAEFPQVEASADVIVRDGPLHTASGAAAGFDLMLQLIEERLGAEVMTEVACWFQHPQVRGPGVPQRVPATRVAAPEDALPPLVARAIRLMAARMDEPPPLSEVAAALGVSTRQLERGFKAATGLTPSLYRRAMRMKAARQMVRHSARPLAEIARAVGYATPQPLLRHYREAFGASPQEERRRANAFRVEAGGSLPTP